MISTKSSNRNTLLIVIAIVILTAGTVALGQATWTNSSSATSSSDRWADSSVNAGGPIETRAGYIDPGTGYINGGVSTNGSYLPPFGSPNSANGAPMGPVGNTGTNQVPGVVGRNPGFGNATGSTRWNANGTVSGTTQAPMTSNAGRAAGAGSPQSSGPLNSAPNGAAGTYGYPNGVDPNGALNNAGATFRNTEAGRSTTSGTTGSVNSVPFEQGVPFGGTTGTSDILPEPASTPR